MITRKMAVDEIEHFLRARRNYYAHEIADGVVSRIDEAYTQIARLTKERDELRNEIEQMEKQEPVGIQHRVPFVNSNGECVGYSMWKDGKGLDHWPHRSLYALPGAQARPAPSVRAEWLPVPENHPTFDPVDLQLSDGSVLCGCVPQSDGDYWWEGPSGEEVFIDPKYARVTHWRLAAAPEHKKRNE